MTWPSTKDRIIYYKYHTYKYRFALLHTDTLNAQKLSQSSDPSDCAVCKCFAINLAQQRMTGTFDAVWLFSGVPAESYFHRMLCMHFSDRLLQETGAGGGGWGAAEQTRLEWNSSQGMLSETNYNAERYKLLTFIQIQNELFNKSLYKSHYMERFVLIC